MDILHSCPHPSLRSWRGDTRAPSGGIGALCCVSTNQAGSLTSVKPRITVSVCNLGVLLQVKSTETFEVMSNILPDQTFVICLWKMSLKWHKMLIMIYAFKGCITTKQGSGMCGDAPLLMNFVYKIDLNVAYYISFCILLVLCWFDSGIVSNICIEQKGTECDWSLCGHNKQFTRKSAKQTKTSIFTVRLCHFICRVSKDKNVNVSAVTFLLFVPLTLSFSRDSFLSLCQSPAPPHFCTDDVKQSAEDEGQLCKDFVSHITKIDI